MMCSKYFVFLQNFVFIPRFKESKDNRRNIYSNFFVRLLSNVRILSINFAVHIIDLKFKPTFVSKPSNSKHLYFVFICII